VVGGHGGTSAAATDRLRHGRFACFVRVLRVDGFLAKMSFGTRIPLCLKDRGAVKPLIESIFNSFLLPPGTSSDSKQILLKILITFQRTFYT
jgi:hypothetical protein